MIKQPEYVFPVSLKGKYEYLQDSNRLKLSIPVRGYERFVPDLIPNNGTTLRTKKENKLSASFRDNPIKESNASIRKNYQYFRNLMPKGFNWIAMNPNELHTFDGVQSGGYTSVFQRGKDTFIFKKGHKIHREDGPAVIAFGKYISWWLNGKMHRTNGPALINFDAGWCSFYVNGKQLSKEEFLKHFDIDDKREKRLPDSLTILEETNFEKTIEEVKTQRAKNWRGFDVDAQLKDEWLEDMNSFMAAYPISVCYGHPASENDHQGAGGPNAGINMRMDNTFRKGEAEDFESLCVDIGKVLKGIPDTKVTVALNTHENGRIPSRFVGSRVSENGRMVGPPDVRKKIKSGEFKVDTAVFHINCRFRTEGNEEKVDKWFESVVKTMKSVFM